MFYRKFTHPVSDHATRRSGSVFGTRTLAHHSDEDDAGFGHHRWKRFVPDSPQETAGMRSGREDVRPVLWKDRSIRL